MSCGLPKCKQARALLQSIEIAKIRAREWGTIRGYQYVTIVQVSDGTFKYLKPGERSKYKEIDTVLTDAA